ncbi:putative sulfatase-modifying factor protein [Magnetofaba australis IT-1]|uniref:Putative sulfatase-modifying factor protein n=2 Tax=Magnetofaba TaxID=1472292 RepID=A0A1Y2JZJ8_9PROT|nr:putative sulfatase-modifying factor protein [Magnetofaba australis IT-1]
MGGYLAFRELPRAQSQRFVLILFSGYILWLGSTLYLSAYLPWNQGEFMQQARLQLPALNKKPQPASGPPAQNHAPAKDANTWVDPISDAVFVKIPGGCFQMGSPADENGRKMDEGPRTRTCVDGFWMAKFETTVGQFKRYMDERAQFGRRALTSAETRGGCRVYQVAQHYFDYQNGTSWRAPGFDQQADHPVTCISWHDASAYVHWLNQRNTGVTYALPSEAQWEYAARAGSPLRRVWDKASRACGYENVLDQSFIYATGWQGSSGRRHNCEDGAVWTQGVGRYRANAFGLHDMLGNVSEWTSDFYAVYPDAEAIGWINDALLRDAEPADKARYAAYLQAGPARINPRQTRGRMNVTRGGCWRCYPKGVRAARRGVDYPNHSDSTLGMRLVMTRRTAP